MIWPLRGFMVPAPHRADQQLKPQAGEWVKVSQGAASAVLPARLDPLLPDGVVRVPAGHPATAGLGPMFGAITVERT